jgi:hypothetical protein
MRLRLLTALMLCLVSACNDHGTAPQGYEWPLQDEPTLHDRSFNILLRYGVGGRNELNTFYDTYTKDLILDGTATTRLVLSEADLDSIESRLNEVDLFSYPDTFVVPKKDTIVTITPYQTYLLRIKSDFGVKSVFWQDSIISSDPKATKLRQVIVYIRTLVETYSEYKGLPPPRGGYI